MLATPVSDDYIIDFLNSEGVDPDDHESWIDSFNSETPGLYDSFEEYYEISIEQMRMFGQVDWDGTDSDISFDLSNAYINSDFY